MANVLIAYDDAAKSLGRFFESCADEARQSCADNGHQHFTISSLNFTEEEVVANMERNQICFIAAHGDPDGIYNDHGDYVVGTRTTNYVFDGKCFYSVSCHCAEKLKGELQRLGLKIFVGYDGPLLVGGDENIFCDCAVEGLRCLFQRQTVAEARNSMIQKYDSTIEKASLMDRLLLLNNKESLVFDGAADSLTIADLQ